MSNRDFTLVSLMGLVLVFLVSCTSNITRPLQSENLVIFPAPPDTARIQYLTSISNSKDIAGEQSWFSRFILGEEEPKTINKPYGVHIQDGKIFICDISINGLEIIDLENQTFEYFIPKGKGALLLPVNCFVDKDYIYIADIQRKQVVIFDMERNFVNAIGEAENFKPTDVFVNNDKIWISNTANNRINVYSKQSLKFIEYLPKSDEGDEDHLYSPTNIWVNDNSIYVSDFGDFKIKNYDQDGTFKASVGSYGNKLGQFVRPKGIAVDNDLNLYVVDAGFENVQVFDKNNKLLMYFGGSYKGPGYMWLPAKVTIDYDNLKYFDQYLDESYHLKYLIFVTNQYGPDKLSIYGAIEPK